MHDQNLIAVKLRIKCNLHGRTVKKPLPVVRFWILYNVHLYYLGNIFRRLFNPSYLGCFSVNFKKLGGFRKLLSISFHMPPSALFYLYSFRNGKRLRRIFRIWLLEKWNQILNSMEARRRSWWRTRWIPSKFGIGNAILPFSKPGQAFRMISIKSWTHTMT